MWAEASYLCTGPISVLFIIKWLKGFETGKLPLLIGYFYSYPLNHPGCLTPTHCLRHNGSIYFFCKHFLVFPSPST